MPTKFVTVIQTRAPLAKALDYYMHPENLPKVHPSFVKDVKILSRGGDVIDLEQHAEIMGVRIVSVNRLWLNHATNTFNVDTLDGEGKGSKITMVVKEVPPWTKVHYIAAMELGPLGLFTMAPAKSTFERMAQEDKQQLDMVA